MLCFVLLVHEGACSLSSFTRVWVRGVGEAGLEVAAFAKLSKGPRGAGVLAPSVENMNPSFEGFGFLVCNNKSTC